MAFGMHDGFAKASSVFQTQQSNGHYGRVRNIRNLGNRDLLWKHPQNTIEADHLNFEWNV